MNIIGYRLGGQDNGTVMFKPLPEELICPVSTAFLSTDEKKSLYAESSTTQNRPETCGTCGYRLDFQAHNPEYRLRSTKRDISETYDGQTIVSVRFRNFCIQNNYEGVHFLPFSSDPNHFHLIAVKIVEFDKVNGRTWNGGFCATCGNYQFVGVSSPYMLEKNTILEDDFYRTDMFFAGGNEKHPLIIVGVETKQKLKAAGLKGLEFSPAYGIE